MEEPKKRNIRIKQVSKFWRASFNLTSPMNPRKEITITVWGDTKREVYDQIKYFIPLDDYEE